MIPRTFFLLLCSALASYAETLPVAGSSIVAQILTDAAPAIQEELGLELKITTEGGSTLGLMAVGSESAQLGLLTRALEAADRAQFPGMNFDQAQLGWQALALGVADDVWQHGVRSLTKEQMIGIYEGTIQNWSQVGGPDVPIKFYNPKRGRGVWELFVTWLYNDQRLAPLGDRFETVVTYKDARDSVEFNAGSISIMPPSFTNGKSVHMIGIKLADGAVVSPTPDILATQKYPIARPLYVISGRRFAGTLRHLVQFLLSPRGQGYVAAVHYVPVGPAELPTAKGVPEPKFTLPSEAAAK